MDNRRLVAELEHAASVVMSPPENVNDGDRKLAEKVFLDLRTSRLPWEVSKQVFESSTNEFVIFQTVSVLKESLVKEWAVLSSETIEAAWKYLLQMLVNRPQISGYVTAEILQAIAVILKRGTFDEKCGDTDTFFNSIQEMVNSDNTVLQSLGCQAMLSLCSEYCTAWRSADVGLTWDFHMRAKRHFESESLKKMLELSLTVLDRLVSSSSNVLPTAFCADRDRVLLCNRFLGVAETVLTWHFGSRMLPKRLTFAVEFSATAALRPPANWSDVLLNENFINFFFRLHTLLRVNSELCHRSMQCLIQLASLMGEAFGVSAIGAESNHTKYIQLVIENILRVFESGPLAHEVWNFSQMIWKLLTYHPLPALLRVQPLILEKFVQLLLVFTRQMCKEAIDETMAGSGDDDKYEEALVKALDAWTIFVKAEGRSPLFPERLFRTPTLEIVRAFLSAVLAPPCGTRPTVGLSSDTDGGDMASEMREEDEDDRELYGDLLANMGQLCRYALDDVLPLITNTLTEKLAIFCTIAGQSNGANKTALLRELPVWQEDVHWMLLLLANTLTSDDYEGNCSIAGNLLSQMRRDSTGRPDCCQTYFVECLQSPQTALSRTDFDGVDLWSRAFGVVLIWAVVEQRLLVGGQTDFLSPQLAQTTLWALRRLVTAYSASDVSETTDEDKPKCPALLVVLKTGSETIRMVLNFVIEKCFLSLRAWSGEEKVAKDATTLLQALFQNQERANEIATSSNLLEQISKLEIQNLTSVAKKELLRSLFLVGVATEDTSVHEKMYLMVLEPLAQRYESLASLSGSSSDVSEAGLLDVFDCFTGIAQAAQQHSAEFVFNYLMPILESSVLLLSGPLKQQPLVVEAILKLFAAFTRRVAIYLDSSVSSNRLYSCLLELLKGYAKEQVYKFQSETVEEEKAQGLLLVMDILMNLLSKDVFVLAGLADISDSVASAAAVSLRGLRLTMPLMSAELLRFPRLCTAFYRLLLYTTEMYPELVISQSVDGGDSLLPNALECIRLGLSSQYGTDVLHTSLEIVQGLSTFACQQEQSDFIRQTREAIGSFIRPTFDACLMYSGEVELFGEATLALYSEICCDRPTYDTMVTQLVGNHDDPMVSDRLSGAFRRLLPSDAVAHPLRREKRAFRDRFELFLNDIQGLLCLNRLSV